MPSRWPGSHRRFPGKSQTQVGPAWAAHGRVGLSARGREECVGTPQELLEPQPSPGCSIAQGLRVPTKPPRPGREVAMWEVTG